MLSEVSSSIFTDNNEIKMIPFVSAEWNYNLFAPPYITFSGPITSETLSIDAELAYTGDNKHPTFDTEKYSLTYDSQTKTSSGDVSCSWNSLSFSSASCKIVTFIKTNNSVPVMVNAKAYGIGSSTQYGSSNIEVNNYGWTKLEIIVGGKKSSDTISGITLILSFNSLSQYPTDSAPDVYFTKPEIYSNQFFNYQYNSLWPTDAAFAYFRPGESYVETGNININHNASTFRKVNSAAKGSFTGSVYAPVSSIIQNPSYLSITQYTPFLKNILPSDVSPYKYFVSADTTQSTVSALYENSILVNKLVIKFNTLITTPEVEVKLNGTKIWETTISQHIPSNGVLVLYYNGSSWSTTKWSTMPQFNSDGSLSPRVFISNLSVTQKSSSLNEVFPTKSGNPHYNNDMKRMQLIEISPRLEVDLTDYVESISISKQLDSKTTVLPISTINANDASITLIGIPLFRPGKDPVPLFSNQSNAAISVLSDMLRKNIKFYIHFNLLSYSHAGSYTETNSFIPAGIFYSDSWAETDIESVNIQCFDSARMLQSVPVPDYVANYKTVFDIISTLLDRSGFTDYDIDSLYEITNDPAAPMDISYYYANSQDKTVIAALADLFLAYQIGAYIDEYGIMKFLSLSKILNSSNNAADLSIDDNHIYQSGYSVSSMGKVGKILLRYQEPKIKQSLALQNATDPTERKSPSFIYTTSNEHLWSSNSLDSIGFNYVANNILSKDNYFTYNINDLLDIFHTFTLNNVGYAIIENEIVSFEYKEYKISLYDDPTNYIIVSIKNDIELAAQVNHFSKSNVSAYLNITTANITNITKSTDSITYTANNTFSVGQKVSIEDVNPYSFNTIGTITAASATSFTIKTTNIPKDSYTSGGVAISNALTNIKIEPTGKIRNVRRGLFGTFPQDHRIAYADPTGSHAIGGKSLQEAWFKTNGAITVPVDGSTAFAKVVSYNPYTTASAESTTPDIKTILFDQINDPTYRSTLLYPINNKDVGYHTYSTKFIIYPKTETATLGIFFNWQDQDVIDGTFFVEFIKVWTGDVDNDNNPVYNAKAGNNYFIVIYKATDFDSYNIVAYADVTTMVKNTLNNFEKVFVKSSGSYTSAYDAAMHLKVVHFNSDGTDGEQEGQIVDVFLNNAKVVGWKIPNNVYSDLSDGWGPTATNTKTALPQLPKIDSAQSDGYPNTVFGVYVSEMTSPLFTVAHSPISSVSKPNPASGKFAYIKEMYATEAILRDRSTNYWHQTNKFLNGLIQNQNIYNNYQSYIMQATPSISGINTYDVQYQIPGATSADILPIQYYQKYFPTNSPIDNEYVQELVVDEYSLSYSTPLNTGFRARFAIANNSDHMVWIHKDPDDLNSASTHLVVWTHEIIAQTDPAVLEKVLNQNNIHEVAQLDAQWIQSSYAAHKVLGLIEKSIDGFSKDTSIKIFGNPLIQVGDIIRITYKLVGLNQRKFVVQAVKHTFNQGLETELILNSVSSGVKYYDPGV